MAKEIVCHLNDEVFYKVKDGTKYIEMRLYDEKRKNMSVGDTIIFVHKNDESQKVKCLISNMLVYDNFAELYEDYDKEALGYSENEEKNPDDMEKFYSKEEQEKYGVVAIELELI